VAWGRILLLVDIHVNREGILHGINIKIDYVLSYLRPYMLTAAANQHHDNIFVHRAKGKLARC
jgi:hypothetical protein